MASRFTQKEKNSEIVARQFLTVLLRPRANKKASNAWGVVSAKELNARLKLATRPLICENSENLSLPASYFAFFIARNLSRKSWRDCELSNSHAFLTDCKSVLPCGSTSSASLMSLICSPDRDIKKERSNFIAAKKVFLKFIASDFDAKVLRIVFPFSCISNLHLSPAILNTFFIQKNNEDFVRTFQVEKRPFPSS